MIGAYHPNGGGRFHHAPAGGQPTSREIVIGGKAGELVPVVIDGIYARIVGPLQIAGKLEIVRWIGKDEIDRGRRQLRHPGDTVADKNAVRLLTL